VETSEEAVAAWERAGAAVLIRPEFRSAGWDAAPPRDAVTTAAAFERSAALSSYVVVERLAGCVSLEVVVVGGEAFGGVAREGEGPWRLVDARGIPAEARRWAERAVGFLGLDVASVRMRLAALADGAEGSVHFVDPRPDLVAFAEADPSYPGVVMEALVERMFPASATRPFPLVAVAGGRERWLVGAVVASELAGRGACVGHAFEGRATVGGRTLPARFGGTDEAARTMLGNARVQVAVVELARSGILHHGLPYRRAAVGVVCGLDSAEGLPLEGWGFEEPDVELPRTERCVVESVAEEGWSVLRADEPRVVAMAEQARGGLILAGFECEPLRSHLASGGRAVVACSGSGIGGACVVERRRGPDLIERIDVSGQRLRESADAVGWRGPDEGAAAAVAVAFGALWGLELAGG
jgi:hypothetical protein